MIYIRFGWIITHFLSPACKDRPWFRQVTFCKPAKDWLVSNSLSLSVSHLARFNIQKHNNFPSSHGKWACSTTRTGRTSLQCISCKKIRVTSYSFPLYLYLPFFHLLRLSALFTALQENSIKYYEPCYVLRYFTTWFLLKICVNGHVLCFCKMSGCSLCIVMLSPGRVQNYVGSTNNHDANIKLALIHYYFIILSPDLL